MGNVPIIQKISLTRYQFPFNDVGKDLSFAMGAFYQPGGKGLRVALGIRVYTDIGVTGEYMSTAPGTVEQIQAFGPYLIGRSALERERFYNQAKSLLRKQDRMGIGPVDIALWDLAGKLYGAPIYQMLGGYREKLPCYASTYHADRGEGRPQQPRGVRGLRRTVPRNGVQGLQDTLVGRPVIEREIETVRAVGRRVGGKMALMIDPCCVYDTFGDTLAVGRACDEYDYYWYEDPMRDGGVSLYAHRQLRRMLKTPLLQGEHVHLVEAHADMAAAEATDFWRADPEYDGGITGAMKIAHSAEGYGMDVELHIAGPAQRHCMAAMRNSNFYEMGLVHPKLPNIANPPVYACDYADQLESIDENGCVDVPTGPGLGVEYDWSGIEKYRAWEIVIE